MAGGGARGTAVAAHPVIPLILSGGSGTRLWPLSRQANPKQFLRFGSEHSLLQDTVLRCRAPVFDAVPVIVAAQSHRHLLAQSLRHIAAQAEVVLEPLARDSCAAVLAGALVAQRRNPAALVLAMAADHQIPDADAFAAAVVQAVDAAARGWLVTFGVQPTFAATGFGYILPGEALAGPVRRVQRFVEKPDAATAVAYCRQGHVWNSGNVLFAPATLLAEARQHVPQVLDAVMRAFYAATADGDGLLLDAATFAASPATSIDYGILEHTGKCAVLPVDYGWNDIGSWDSVARAAVRDGDGNALTGPAVALGSTRATVVADGRLTAVVGCEDVVVVSARDAVLVTRAGHADGVKALVAQLRADGHVQADTATRLHRPWGHADLLAAGAGYRVQRMVLDGGAALARTDVPYAEHWSVVEGAVTACAGGLTLRLSAQQSVTVPAGAALELRNAGAGTAVLIVVQTGAAGDGNWT